MPEFFYKATTLSGQSVEGSMEAKDEAAILQNLHRMGYIPIRIGYTESKKRVFRFPHFISRRVGIRELLVFTQEFSNLLSAGLPLDRSLSILESLSENKRLKETLKNILQRVEGGNSLAEALSYHPQIFPKLYVNMVRAGEAGGFLEVILSRLVRYLQNVKEIREALISVMIYPLILTFISGISIVILVTFVVPRFARIFSDMGQAIPIPTQIVLTLSHWIRDYWWIGLGAVILAYASLKLYIRQEERRFQWDQFKLKWFILGDLLRKMEVARFSRILGTLLQSGVSILTALNLVKEISQNLVFTRAIRITHDRLREGKGISKSLVETGVFPPLAIQMIGVGEETGRLDEMLLRVAEVYEENVQMALKRFVSLLEPIVIVLMGGLVGFIVISMLLAIFSINEIPF